MTWKDFVEGLVVIVLFNIGVVWFLLSDSNLPWTVGTALPMSFTISIPLFFVNLFSLDT